SSLPPSLPEDEEGQTSRAASAAASAAARRPGAPRRCRGPSAMPKRGRLSFDPDAASGDSGAEGQPASPVRAASLAAATAARFRAEAGAKARRQATAAGVGGAAAPAGAAVWATGVGGSRACGGGELVVAGAEGGHGGFHQRVLRERRRCRGDPRRGLRRPQRRAGCRLSVPAAPARGGVAAVGSGGGRGGGGGARPDRGEGAQGLCGGLQGGRDRRRKNGTGINSARAAYSGEPTGFERRVSMLA
ncbi:unnamed protein product, partial [Prorocentrum cordatum]